MITNLTSHYTVCHRRMSTDPSWRMRTTTLRRWACSGHLWVTNNTSKTIPARGDIVPIASDWALTSKSDKTVCCIEALVVAAWVIRCNCWNNIYQFNEVTFTEQIFTLEPINEGQGKVVLDHGFVEIKEKAMVRLR